MFSASVEDRELIAMFDRLAASADFVCRLEGLETAKRIVAEAQRRVSRATGVTASEIHFELTRDGNGYVVLGFQPGVGDVPIDIYLEHGTEDMRARPFFFSSAALESESHLRRLTDRIAQWLEDLGR